MKVVNLDEISYQEALSIQEKYVEDLRVEGNEEILIFCSHPPVVTLGKKTIPGDLGSWTGETFEVARGGSATYHGPSQVVCYPIIRLRSRNNDIHKYLRALEDSMVEVLFEYDVIAHGDENSTGVWIGPKKIASIGIAVRRGITFHGLALNLYKDDQAFSGINPCGMETKVMTSLEELMGVRVIRREFEGKLERKLLSKLDISL